MKDDAKVAASFQETDKDRIRKLKEFKAEVLNHRTVNSSLDASSLLNLGWHGCFDAEQGFAHTVKILSQAMSK